ncbi:MAG: efflux RND transporter periplasmic adaptor subunit [Desulfuromonas sp.]|nr:efflux RND transporter periplasmic adaptor subunit [Desulfuromonas sp.]
MTNQQPTPPADPETPKLISRAKGLSVPLRILLVLLIIALGVSVAVFLKKSAPKAQKQAPVKRAYLVQTQMALASQAQVSITCFGQVVPARSVNLQSQVSGQVIAMNPHFDVGARLASGSELVQIEPRDYQLAVASQQAAVEKAAAALEIEMGQQDIAQQEWQIYQSSTNSATTATDSAPSPLALRQPYLQQAQAELLASKAALEQAQLSLQRTTISAPFDCLVLSKSVDIGTQLSSQTTLASVVATDEFWVEVSVALDQLPWLALPDINSSTGAPAHITLQGRELQRTGQVIRLLGDLASGSRMARLLVAIPDPFDLKRPLDQRQPLLLGEYVEVTLLGQQLNNIINLPRSALHNGNQVWIASSDNTLSVRPVNIVWKDRQRVFIDEGIKPGEAIITSDLATAVDGMAVRVATNAEPQQ